MVSLYDFSTLYHCSSDSQASFKRRRMARLESSSCNHGARFIDKVGHPVYCSRDNPSKNCDFSDKKDLVGCMADEWELQLFGFMVDILSWYIEFINGS